MTTFFGRRANVLVQRAGSATPISLFAGGDATGVVPPTGGLMVANVFDGLHVRFKAEKNYIGQPNTLDLSIYNLAASTRRELQGQGGFVKLLAGYQSDFPNLPTIFQGNARTIDHLRDGPDWVTRIQAGDGETAYRFGYASQTFPAGTPLSQIAIYLAQQLKAGDPLNIDITAFVNKAPSIAYPTQAFSSGWSVLGNAFEELSRLLGSKYTVSIQDGELRALQSTEYMGGTTTCFKISASTGLIGSPEHGTPNLSGQPPVLKLHCLLNARIKPGDLVNVDSLNLQGNFRVQKVTHTGDLAGNDWFTEIDATSLAVGNLPFN